jgi:hypothetical protein
MRFDLIFRAAGDVEAPIVLLLHGLRVAIEQNGEELLEGTHLLIVAGRVPNTREAGLDLTGVEFWCRQDYGVVYRSRCLGKCPIPMCPSETTSKSSRRSSRTSLSSEKRDEACPSGRQRQGACFLSEFLRAQERRRPLHRGTHCCQVGIPESSITKGNVRFCSNLSGLSLLACIRFV